MAANNQRLTVMSALGVKHRKLLLATLAVLVVCLAGSQLITPQAYAVEVSGETIGYVRDAKAILTLADSLAMESSERLGVTVTVGDELQLRQVPAKGLTVNTPEELREKLAAVLPLSVAGCLVSIDGDPVVSLLSEDDGEAVLAELQEEYRTRYADKPGTVVEDIRIAEAIEICPANVPLPELKTREEAKLLLATGATEAKEYQVVKGDSFWSIAAAHSLTVEDLTKANPEVKPNRLSIGQKISMVVPKPYLTITSQEKVTVTESVGFPEEVVKDSSKWAWERVIKQRGTAGWREVVYAITRQNGQVVDKKIVSQSVVKEPVKQVVLQGTKQDTSELAKGSGQFMWPAVGKITSNFGVRRVSRGSSYHTGIDIGMPTGTQVKAADAGVVTKAEYAGNYGRVVIINHGNGYSTLYAHNSSLSVKVGNKVTKGQVIALSGNTGLSTGPHLHFEIRLNDKPLNPLNFFK